MLGTSTGSSMDYLKFYDKYGKRHCVPMPGVNTVDPFLERNKTILTELSPLMYQFPERSPIEKAGVII